MRCKSAICVGPLGPSDANYPLSQYIFRPAVAPPTKLFRFAALVTCKKIELTLSSLSPANDPSPSSRRRSLTLAGDVASPVNSRPLSGCLWVFRFALSLSHSRCYFKSLILSGASPPHFAGENLVKGRRCHFTHYLSRRCH